MLTDQYIWINILSRLNHRDIVQYSRTNKCLYRAFYSDELWRHLLYRDFDIHPDDDPLLAKNPQDVYAMLLALGSLVTVAAIGLAAYLDK